MNDKETKSRFLNMTTLTIAGVLLLLLSAVILLLHGNATSNQAMPALVAQVYFDGDYRIADGEWQKIVEGEHIPSTKGDVTLRGNFHMLTPDGEYIGVYSDDIPIAFYTDHINLTFYEGENEPYVMDIQSFIPAVWKSTSTKLPAITTLRQMWKPLRPGRQPYRS